MSVKLCSEKVRDSIPTSGFQDASGQEKDNAGNVAMLLNWRHLGFHVFCGDRIWPKDETATF